MNDESQTYQSKEIPYEEPDAVERAINVFKQLPGIGDRTARRIVYWLISTSGEQIDEFAEAFRLLKEQIKICSLCFNVSISDPCNICSSTERDHSTICVVAEPRDVSAIEMTRIYNGVYHILGGVLDALKGIGPEQLHIDELIQRASSDEVKEIILALDPSNEGEITARHISKLLEPVQVKLTVLAQGISAGSTLEFTDPKTLTNAIKNRRPI
ncbi:recombination protein RecR [bacterium]|nr:MAG: recombination protein RecR [bacterium]